MRPAAASADESLRLRPLVNAVSEQATFKLAPNGTIITGNPGVEKLRGYPAHQIVGSHFSCFHPPADSVAGNPRREPTDAARDGVRIDDGCRLSATQGWQPVLGACHRHSLV
jgi:hypothetical protein